MKATEMQPKVSIGMPVYNGEKTIKKAINTLLAQTFRDFELIISDNASDDETENICRRFALKDKRIHYLRQSKNLGASANFNFLLSMSKNPWKIFRKKPIEFFIPLYEFSKYALGLMKNLEYYEWVYVFGKLLKVNLQAMRHSYIITIK